MHFLSLMTIMMITRKMTIRIFSITITFAVASTSMLAAAASTFKKRSKFMMPFVDTQRYEMFDHMHH